MSSTAKEIHAMDAEKQLAEQIRKEYISAFSGMYDKYAPSLLGMILRMVNDQEKAEQILQATFLETIRTLTKYNPAGERLFTRMLKTAKNLALAGISENKTKPEIQHADHFVGENTSGHYSPGKQHPSATFREPQQFNALDLIYTNGCSYEKAALQLGISVDELKVIIRRELKQRRTN